MRKQAFNGNTSRVSIYSVRYYDLVSNNKNLASNEVTKQLPKHLINTTVIAIFIVDPPHSETMVCFIIDHFRCYNMLYYHIG